MKKTLKIAMMMFVGLSLLMTGCTKEKNNEEKPEDEVTDPQHCTITWTVNPSDGGIIVDKRTNENITGRKVTYSRGATITVFIEENYGDYYRLNAIVVDGVSVNLSNDPDFAILTGYFEYTIRNLQANHTCVLYFVK